MRLSELIPGYKGTPDPEITALAADSRQVKRGSLFAAMPGNRADGRKFIDDAVQLGAAAILAQSETIVPPGVILISADNPRQELAHIAARYYARQPRHMVAVTGTNGKTSTVYFTQQLWESLGIKAASLGTLGLRGAGLTHGGSMTTPDPITLHGQLADLAASGFDHVAMEASSHGLAQYRLDGLRVSAAGFTNLTRDHLDYHPTMEDYLQAKARLFTDVLADDGIAVLNADVPEFERLKELCKTRILSYGARGDIKLVNRQPLPQGQALTLSIARREYKLTLPLVGAFQVMNALCALGLVMAEAPEDMGRTDALIEALRTLQGAPGRLQLVPGHPEGAAVYVDYAHTPDALENVIAALRPHTDGRLFCVFGCGGDRDPGKRSIMGRIAVEQADMVIVTDDNPRSEDPAKIRAAIINATDHRAEEIGDRRTAIAYAIEEMGEGDVLVIAGKGHEQGQIIGDRVDPFDDVTEAAHAIEHLKRKQGKA
ncbi:MAG: UDP-N-acetylmuramoyl-L-alanyl-D-glutamate--2,6-diaminopimelate ligase [Alphaproteobacteria bacterium]|nr:UDP-N-acetylmuramoyl-L-alanyl-D-glutamate--2,6-diaminopimelate ligase [Alphaproteobacteria bacterium]